MPYHIHEVDLTRQLAPITVPEGDTGVALVVRHAGRPIGFLMQDLAAGTVLSTKDLEAIATQGIDLSSAATERGPQAFKDLTFGETLPSLSIAVCTKDRPEDLATCLDRLLRVRYAEKGGRIEILVVDNAPSDRRTFDLVRHTPGVRYVTDPRPGLDFARNCAVREAAQDILAFVDDDVTVDESWLLGLKKALSEYPDAGAVTGLVLPAELATDAQILFEKRGGFQKHFATTRYGQSLPGHPFYPCVGGKFGTGCNMAFRTEILRKLGGFDEALDAGAVLPGGGDTDMLYRVVRAGHPLVYEPQFQVFHRHRREIQQLQRQYSRSWGMGLMAYVAKTYGTDPAQRGNLRRLVRWWFANELAELSRSLQGRHVLPPGMLVAELWGGVMGLCGTYGRSRRRARRILEQHASAATQPVESTP